MERDRGIWERKEREEEDGEKRELN
jgi:hypothetical protein